VANPNISTVGRFSSFMLTYLGTQKTVKTVSGNSTNTFKYNTEPTVFPSSGSISQSYLGGGVVGSLKTSNYNSIKCFFLSRGASEVYADTMTSLTLDIATMTGVSPISLLEAAEDSGRLMLTDNAYSAFNNLRDPGNQVGKVTAVDNRYSLQARQIRA